MIRSEAVAQIQEGLGFRTDLVNNIILRLKEAQRLLESGRTLPYFLKAEDQTLLVPSGNGDVALPDGFIREVDDDILHFTNPSTNETVTLEKFVDPDRMRRSLTGPDVDAGFPKAYLLRKATITFLPERSTSVTLTWSFYKKAVVLDNDVENDWLKYAPDALIGKAGGLMVRAIGVSDAGMQKRLEHFQALEAEGWAAIRAEGFERDSANYPLYMGSRL